MKPNPEGIPVQHSETKRRRKRRWPLVVSVLLILGVMVVFVVTQSGVDKGIDHDIFNAVRHSRIGISNLLEADQRIQSMQAFRQHQQAPNLIAANKRVSNILKKTPIGTAAEPDPVLFQEDAEHKLAAEVLDIRQAFENDQLGYEDKFLRLANLQPLVDRYFDDVMVMADDEKLRNNRLSTLAKLKMIFLEVADFSRLQS